jgi:hypothetical protein
MNATEFLRMRKIVAEDKTDLIIGFSDGSKQSLIELLDEYCKMKGTRKKKLDYNIVFETIKKDVKNGYSIENACIKNKIKRATLYFNMTDLQKKELISYKITTSKSNKQR